MKDEPYLDKILKSLNLINIVEDKWKFIWKLKRILCLFKNIDKFTEITNEFNKIKNDIRCINLMLKDL